MVTSFPVVACTQLSFFTIPSIVACFRIRYKKICSLVGCSKQGPVRAHASLEKALLRHSVPYTVVKGVQVLDRAAVKVWENPLLLLHTATCCSLHPWCCFVGTWLQHSSHRICWPTVPC